jgi:hypothetical protein
LSAEDLNLPKLLNVLGDGQCGFRCLAAAVYGSEEDWKVVKSTMFLQLATYMEFYDELFGQDNRLMSVLQHLESPCSENLWFYTPDCAQLAADTFQRTIAIFDLERPDYSLLYIPIMTACKDLLPIGLCLRANHFQLATFSETDMETDYRWPTISPQYAPLCNQLQHPNVSNKYSTWA